jgi:hypothetical protein
MFHSGSQSILLVQSSQQSFNNNYQMISFSQIDQIVIRNQIRFTRQNPRFYYSTLIGVL